MFTCKKKKSVKKVFKVFTVLLLNFNHLHIDKKKKKKKFQKGKKFSPHESDKIFKEDETFCILLDEVFSDKLGGLIKRTYAKGLVYHIY